MNWLKWIVDKLSSKATKEATIDEYDVPVAFLPKHRFMDGDRRKQLTKQKNEFLGSGWAFPVTFSIGTLELELTEYEQNINDSIKTLPSCISPTSS